MTLAGLLLVAFGVALIGAGPALADRIEDKRAEAQQVLADIEALDAELGQSIEAYNAATIELDAINADLDANRRQMGVARGNLGVAQRRLANRLRDLYVGGDSTSALEVFLGSTSFEDLINRLDTIDRVSQEDTQVLQEVQRFRTEVTVRRGQLKKAQANQESVVAARAAAKREIEAGLAERQELLSSIRGEIERLRAEEARRQEILAQQAALRLASQEAAEQQRIDTSVIGAGAETPEAADRAAVALRRRRRDRDAVPRHPVRLGRRLAGVGLRLLRVRRCTSTRRSASRSRTTRPRSTATASPSRTTSSRPATSSSSTGSATWASTSAAASSSTRRTRATS